MEQTGGHHSGLVTVRSVTKASLTALVVVLLAWGLYTARGAVAAIAASALLATALLHGVDALVRRGWKRRAANAMVLGAFLLGIALFAFFVMPKLAGQLAELISRGPETLDRIRESKVVKSLATHYHIDVTKTPKPSSQNMQAVAAPALTVLGSAVTLLVRLVMVLFLTSFMVLFGRDVVRAAVGLARPEWRERYDRVLESIYRSVGGYLAGLALICFINATLTTIFLAITGMPYFLPLGILSGFSSLVPYAGPFVVHTSLTAFAFASAGVWKGVATLAYFLVYDNLEGNVLGPLVFKRTVHVNPLVSLVSVILLGEFAGVVGALVAVPAAAAAQIVIREYVAVRRGESPT